MGWDGGGDTGRCTWNENWGDGQPPLCTKLTWKGFPGAQRLGKLQSGIQTQLLPFFQLFLPYKHQVLFCHPASNNAFPSHPDSDSALVFQAEVDGNLLKLPPERRRKILKCQPLLFLQLFPGSSSGFAVCIRNRDPPEPIIPVCLGLVSCCSTGKSCCSNL